MRVKILPNGKSLPVIEYKTIDSAGMDLYSAVASDVIVESGKTAMIPTGIAIALDRGYEAQVRPRSGLALKNGITVLNSPGTVDADYRGEISVIIINHSDKDFVVERGMRIAQMVIAQYHKAEIEVVEELDDTARGEGGFGSTGVK